MLFVGSGDTAHGGRPDWCPLPIGDNLKCTHLIFLKYNTR